MKFYSPDFEDFKPLPASFTCDGENKSPVFMIGDVPHSAKELILICHDPDATSGHDWTHWLVVGIPTSTTQISDTNMPKGAKTLVSSFSETSYGGPCPPHGSDPHRYIFSLYAVDEKVSITEKSSREDVLKAIAGHILAQGTWTGTYQRLIV